MTRWISVAVLVGLIFANTIGTSHVSVAMDLSDGWQDIGTVEKWVAMDSHFYRIVGLTGSPGPKIFEFKQKDIYAATKVHDAVLPRLDLASFLALNPAQQAQRQDAARNVLRYVRDFRDRMADLVLRVKGQYDVGWGKQDHDIQAVGDMLGRLHTAVGLDPSQVHAWHLLSYLALSCGDNVRALDALDGCDAALGALPDTVLVDVRRRAHLDRAWILRDLGYFAQAQEVLHELDDAPDLIREIHLLRGLLAAQTGDLNLAFRIAADLERCEVPVFQLDWESPSLAAGVLDPQAWPQKPSSHLKGWILALAWLREGDTSQAKEAFPEYSLDRHYEMGQRFLNEAAVIYEATGRRDLAVKFWAMAHLYVPYQPYLVFKPYGLSLASVTGRRGKLPFVLGFDSHFQTGSRLAYGLALVSQALATTERREQIRLAAHAVTELEICLRSGVDTVGAALALAHAQAVLGNAFEMLRAVDMAEAALDRPGQDQSLRAAVASVRATAMSSQTHPVLPGAGQWEATLRREMAGETLPATEARLRAAYERNPLHEDARRDLAWFLLRYGDPVEAARLIEEPVRQAKTPTPVDWILVLELDRLHNKSARAEHLLQSLLAGHADRWPDAHLWLLVGIICQEHGVADADLALEHALALAPDNDALRAHLETGRP